VLRSLDRWPAIAANTSAAIFRRGGKSCEEIFSGREECEIAGRFLLKTAGNIIIAGGRRSSFRSLIRSGRVSELADPLGQLGRYVNEQFSGADYVQAQRVRDLLQKKMDAMFDIVDVLVAATQP